MVVPRSVTASVGNGSCGRGGIAIRFSYLSTCLGDQGTLGHRLTWRGHFLDMREGAQEHGKDCAGDGEEGERVGGGWKEAVDVDGWTMFGVWCLVLKSNLRLMT
jgi:hypothetical protein